MAIQTQTQDALAIAGSIGTVFVLVFWLCTFVTIPELRRQLPATVRRLLPPTTGRSSRGGRLPGTVVFTGLVIFLVGLLVVQLVRLFLQFQ